MEDAAPTVHSPPTSPTRPKGILKHSGLPTGGTRLTWDEENLALTEIGKDSLMKITEPKTPYVRYNAELDTVEGMSEIPPFHLDDSAPSSPTHSITQGNIPAHPSGQRQASVDRSSRRASFTDRPSSSRSTSFNLGAPINPDPEHAAFKDGASGGALGFTAGDEAESDEEVDEETAAKRAEFRKARGRHYSNEAEAMKRAQALMAEDEDDSGDSNNPPAAANGLADVQMADHTAHPR